MAEAREVDLVTVPACVLQDVHLQLLMLPPRLILRATLEEAAGGKVWRWEECWDTCSGEDEVTGAGTTEAMVGIIEDTAGITEDTAVIIAVILLRAPLELAPELLVRPLRPLARLAVLEVQRADKMSLYQYNACVYISVQ
eukprot:TRINITY_DN2969_c0_g1_i3.p3 TRINITY_DN2969_c0_g1~~TRINITY_DN2969_c0_g1_i3.p3  ORF type:complete len:140 (+),score=8.79 TRINITY_DN2969_c0_g1_i3:380-799(+)